MFLLLFLFLLLSFWLSVSDDERDKDDGGNVVSGEGDECKSDDVDDSDETDEDDTDDDAGDDDDGDDDDGDAEVMTLEEIKQTPIIEKTMENS